MKYDAHIQEFCHFLLKKGKVIAFEFAEEGSGCAYWRWTVVKHEGKRWIIEIHFNEENEQYFVLKQLGQTYEHET